MKIKKIDTILTSPSRNYLIVKIITNKGIIGYGDATLNGRELVVKSLIDHYLSDFLKGLDASNIKDIWHMIYKGTYWRGGPVLMTALSGIDMALWDIKGRELGAPLFHLLGGKTKNKLKTYYHAHGSCNDELLKECAKKLKKSHYVRFSFDSIDPFNKEKVYQQPHQDINRGRIEEKGLREKEWNAEVYKNDLLEKAETLRKHFGKEIGLIHDVHGRLSPSQAADVAQKLEKYNLFFLEDPVSFDNYHGLKTIRQKASTPLAVGELFNEFSLCKEFISKQLIDYIRVDISHFGGITPVLKLANFADIYGIKLALHAPSDISPVAHSAIAHINFIAPNFGIQEAVDFNSKTIEVFDVPFKIENGYLTLKDRPGLGVNINEEEAYKYKYDKRYLPILRSNLGQLVDW